MKTDGKNTNWLFKLRYAFLAFATFVVLYGLVNQLGPNVLAANPPDVTDAPPPAPAPEAPAPQQPAPQQPQPAPSKPSIPPSLSGSCPGGTTGSLNWTTVPDVKGYDIRVDGATSHPSNNCGGHGICINDYNGTSINFTTQPGQTYNGWVHASNGGDLEGPSSNIFTINCSAPAAQPTIPSQVMTPPTNGSASCPTNGQAYFQWSPATASNKSVVNYTLRINKSPGGDWSPNSGSGDVAVEVGANTSRTQQLTPGTYEDWTVQTGFSDGSVGEAVHFGAFVCQAQVAPTTAPAAPTNTPTPTPTLVPGAPSPTPTNTPTPTPTLAPGAPTPTPTTVPATVVSCPSGFNQVLINNIIMCQQQTATGGNATATGGNSTVTINNPAAPLAPGTIRTVRVASGGAVGEVKQLPKTGLPLGAWALSGLVPFGYGLKRFASIKGATSGSFGKEAWQKRGTLKHFND